MVAMSLTTDVYRIAFGEARIYRINTERKTGSGGQVEARKKGGEEDFCPESNPRDGFATSNSGDRTMLVAPPVVPDNHTANPNAFREHAPVRRPEIAGPMIR